ncbi:hypothetical protein [Dactylosporangium sp. CA-092794]|uniref:hypothetical protein n=1 Tax=Dactylosporangium sp. CA-092794 TaxID=3239929 RepID=UPI003D8AA228
MSDFDEVLERLLGDPGFKARLAADPQGALAGYHLTPDELDILHAQLGDAGGQTHVEQRTSKASMFGVLSSIGTGLGDALHGHGGVSGHALGGSGAAGVGHRMHDIVEQAGGRHAAPAGGGAGGLESPSLAQHVQDAAQGGRHAASGLEEVHVESHQESYTEYHSEVRSSGTVYQSSTYAGGTGGTPHEPPAGGAGGAAGSLAGFGAGGAGGVAGGLSGFDQYQGQGGAGGVAGSAAGGLSGFEQHQGQGGGIGGGFAHLLEQPGQGGAGQPGQGGFGPAGQGGIAGGMGGLVQQAAHAQVPGQAPTDGYHTRVDWDGDGRWDQHTYVNRADGGVDIVVDTDGDGRAEFIGHDTDRDGLINSSEIDTNHDGVMDARYEDVNGDGWLDRRTR